MKYQDDNQNMAYFAEELVLDETSQEELDASNETYTLFNATIDNIRAGVAAGHISAEEGAAYQAQALVDLQAQLAEIFEIEADGYDDTEYSEAEGDVAEFEAGSNFGAAILELAAEEYEDQLEGLMALADEYGLKDDELVALIQGTAAPTDELAEAIGSFFDTTSEDEEAYMGLMVLAAEAQEEVSEEGDEDEYDDEEDEDEEDEEDEASYKIAEVEGRLAEFEATQYVKSALSQLESYAEEGVSLGWLPPVAKQKLFGNFSREEDRVASFSTACEANSIDPQTQLFGIEYALNVFEKCGPLVRFGAYVDEPISEQEVEFERSAEKQALLNFQLMKERG